MNLDEAELWVQIWFATLAIIAVISKNQCCSEIRSVANKCHPKEYQLSAETHKMDQVDYHKYQRIQPPIYGAAIRQTFVFLLFYKCQRMLYLSYITD